MVKVYPKIELQAQHIFKDSKGQRHTLNPAASMADVDKTPQEFDGTDRKVAAKIMEQLKAKTVKVTPADKAILESTLAAAPEAASAAEPEKGASQEDIETAKKEAAMEATSVANNANEKVVSTLKEKHKTALGDLKEKHKTALGDLKEKHKTALDGLRVDYQKAQKDLDANKTEIDGLKADLEEATKPPE